MTFSISLYECTSNNYGLIDVFVRGKLFIIHIYSNVDNFQRMMKSGTFLKMRKTERPFSITKISTKFPNNVERYVTHCLIAKVVISCFGPSESEPMVGSK